MLKKFRDFQKTKKKKRAFIGNEWWFHGGRMGILEILSFASGRPRISWCQQLISMTVSAHSFLVPHDDAAIS